MTDSLDLVATAAELCERYPTSHSLHFAVGDCRIQLDTNSAALKDTLTDYFRHVIAEPGTADFRLVALEAPEPDFGVDLADWPRDPGKVGKKEAFADLPGGRLIHKVRTGMQFLLLSDRVVAVGACVDNANQVINLVNSQYLSWLVRRGYLVCHAAGVLDGKRGLGLAGVSGAGKSTLALSLLADGLNYVSNDRLLVGAVDGQLQMEGVPKMPRINPGTIMGNERLWPILSDQRLSAVRDMARDELWELEEKYDADVDRLFGSGTTVHGGPIDAFAVLTWSHKNSGPMQTWEGPLRERPHLLDAIVKHPGIFHTVPGKSGATPPPVGPPDPAPYLEVMGDLPTIELSGGVDFAGAAAYCRRVLESIR